MWFEQIYKDYKISSKSIHNRVFWLIPIHIDNIEFNSAVGEDSLFSGKFKMNQVRTQLNLTWVPVPSKDYEQIPKCLVIKNAKVDYFPGSISLPQLTSKNFEKIISKESNSQCIFSSDWIYQFLKSQCEIEDRLEGKNKSSESSITSNQLQMPKFNNK